MKTANQKAGRVSLARFLLNMMSPNVPARGPLVESKRELTAPRKKILIVDDDEVILKTTSMKLKGAGYDVITAVDGSEAITVIGNEKPDLILLDINFPPDVAHGGIPTWDGFRLMFWLRGLVNTLETRYIIISGGDSAQFRERAMRAGALAFFPKPIDHEQLLAVIDRELDGPVGKPQPGKGFTALFNFF